MDLKGHFICYSVGIVILAILNYTWLFFTDKWTFFLWLIPMFLVNPDIDLLLQHLFGKGHRNLFTHSALLPLAFYGAIRDSLGTNPNYATLCLLFFFPVFVHLLADFKLSTVAGALADDLKEKVKTGKVKPGDEHTGGTWRITLRPFLPYTLSFYQTLAWIVLNLVFMLVFTLYNFGIFA